MPYIKAEVIQEAKKMDLLTYLRNYEPSELIHVSGNTYCTREHDSLKISNGKWCWWSRNIGGRSALDYLIKVKGMEFCEAVEHITGKSALQYPSVAQTIEKKRTQLQIPVADDTNEIVISYLRRRGIDTEIINDCIDQGLLYQTADYKNVAFVGFDMIGKPGLISLRGTNGSAYKNTVLGSDKRYTFKLLAKNDNGNVHLFESAIDALSYATLIKMMGSDYKNYNLVSMEGIYRGKQNMEESRLPKSLSQYLKEHPETTRVLLHLDNDLPGIEAAKAIGTVIPEGIQCCSMPPPYGKDCNEYLCEQLKLLNEKKKIAEKNDR